jgi:hypothetical protein
MIRNERFELIDALCNLIQEAHIHCRFLSSFGASSDLQQCRMIAARVYLVSDSLHNVSELLRAICRDDFTTARDWGLSQITELVRLRQMLLVTKVDRDVGGLAGVIDVVVFLLQREYLDGGDQKSGA